MIISDVTTLIIAGAVGGALGLVLLYFVVKAAIRNALIEDRAFLAKVERIKAERR